MAPQVRRGGAVQGAVRGAVRRCAAGGAAREARGASNPTGCCKLGPALAGHLQSPPLTHTISPHRRPAPTAAGQAVPRTQRVAGVDFSYQPPPRHIVPYAAALKGQGSAR